MNAHAQTAVPPDLTLYATLGVGAVGTMPGCAVDLVPYPESRRFWVRVRWEGRGETTDSRAYAPGELMVWLLYTLGVCGLDYRRLDWSPDFDAGSATVNPFVTRRTG